MTAAPHAEIAGAGFCGLVAGTVLARRGWSVRIHEVSPILRAFGAGIFLWENGLRVLRTLGLEDAVLSRAFEARSWDDIDEHGDVLATRLLPIPQVGRMITLTRQDLYEPLLAAARAAGVEIVTSSEAMAATPGGELQLKGGEARRADLVIAADGIRSRIARDLGLVAREEVFPVGVFRTLVPWSAAERNGAEWQRYISYWTPRRRLLYVPCNAETLYLLLGAKLPDDAAIAQPVDHELWAREFPAVADAIRRIGPQARFDHYEVKSCSAWSAGRVAILGDAAHAMPPTLGQGAGTGMMNALALATLVAEAHDIPAALKAWEAQERELTEHTQRISVDRVHEWTPPKVSAEKAWSGQAIRTAAHIPHGSQPAAGA